MDMWSIQHYNVVALCSTTSHMPDSPPFIHFESTSQNSAPGHSTHQNRQHKPTSCAPRLRLIFFVFCCLTSLIQGPWQHTSVLWLDAVPRASCPLSYTNIHARLHVVCSLIHISIELKPTVIKPDRREKLERTPPYHVPPLSSRHHILIVPPNIVVVT